MDEQEHSGRRLRGWTFEAFLNLLFEELPQHEHGLDLVLGDPDLLCADYDPSENLTHLARLFESQDILKSLPPANVAKALRFVVFVGDWRDGFIDHLWDSDVAWEARSRCIRSIESLYAALGEVEDEDLRRELFMLWDEIASDYRHGKRDLPGSEDERVQQEMFETLLRILNMSTDSCRAAALHGLNHLSHPHTKEAIESWLSRTSGLEEDLRSYAHACSFCTVM